MAIALTTSAILPGSAATGAPVRQPSTTAPADANLEVALGRTIVVSTRGSDRNPGTVARPMRTISAAIGRAGSGDLIALRRGVYHPSVVVPAGKRLTIAAYRSEEVILDGSVRVTHWRRSDGDWVRRNWRAQFNASPTFTWNQPDDPRPNWRMVGSHHPMAAHPDQVWVNGRRMQQVASRSQVRPGTFYVDNAGDRLYLGSDPRGRRVRASTLAHALSVRGDGTVLRGLRFQRYAPSVPHIGAVTIEARNVRIERSRFVDNATIGLGIVNGGASLYKVRAERNGLLGILATFADGLRVRGVHVGHNNTERFNHAPSAGGMKIGRSRNIRVRGSTFEGNAGTGFWADISTYDMVFANVTSRGNHLHGLFLEISTKAIVVDSLVLGNRGDGIKVNNTSQVEIWNSTLHRNGRSINVVQDPRSSTNPYEYGHNPRRPFPDPTMLWVNRPVTIRNTIVSSTRGNCLVCVEDYSRRFTAEQLRVTLQGNVYQRETSRSPYWFAIWSRGAINPDPAVFTTLGAYRNATRQDLNSRLLQGRPAVMRSGRAVAAVRDMTPRVAVPIPAHIARIADRPTGARHLGAWID